MVRLSYSLFSIQEVSLLRCASFAFLYSVFCFNDCWAIILLYLQRARKVMSDGMGLVDFAIGLVIFVLNLPDRQVLFFWENSNYRGIVINPTNQKRFWGLLK